MFHIEFAKAAHNTALVQMVRSLVSVMSSWGRIFEWAPGRAQQELRFHRELLECRKLQKPEAMRQKMQEHVLVTRQALMTYLQHGRDEATGSPRRSRTPRARRR